MYGRRTLAAAVAGVTLLVAGCTSGTDRSGGSKPRNAVVLHVLSTRGGAEVHPFTDAVTSLSRGALRLDVSDKWERTSVTAEADAIKALQAGQADLGIVPARAFHDAGVTSFDALVAPLAVDSMALQRKVLASDLPAHMLSGVKRLGLTGVGILPGPMRKPAGITRPLRAPADYQGATVAISPSAVADRAIRALGATPVRSAFEGADISGFDGIEQQVWSVAGNQWDGTVRTITENVNLWPRPLVVVAGAKAMRKLSDQQLGWLRAAVHDSVDAGIRLQMYMDTDGLVPMCRRERFEFVTAAAGQIAQLRSAFRPVYAELSQDAQTSRYLDAIDAMRGGTTPYPQEVLTCGATSSEAVGAATPIDGVYEQSFTARELLAAGSADALPENYGTTRWVLDRGRFEQNQRSDRAATWTRGHYTVQGDRLTLYVEDAGGIAPSNANGKPGESATLRWTRYRDKLRLRPERDGMRPDEYPLGATIKLWQRIGDASSSSTAALATPFDGTYRMVTTEREALRSDPHVAAENWGTWTFVFAKGRFAFTQENRQACTWGYGTYVASDDHVEWTFTDGGGIAPNQATNKPGEDFTFGWSRYRDTMTVTAVGNGDVSPENFLAEPWHRRSASAVVSLLSTRCRPPAQALSGL
jgi:TRAP-type C4-dicarboxylate transport system substrate-binding protein